jgi:hypothetical protein
MVGLVLPLTSLGFPLLLQYFEPRLVGRFSTALGKLGFSSDTCTLVAASACARGKTDYKKSLQ